MNDLPDFARLREAIAAVKAHLATVAVENGPNDLIITAIDDHGDLWLFSWNNGWPLLGRPEFGYPGCDPIAVSKSDGRLTQLDRSYGWVEGSFDDAIAAVRAEWQASPEEGTP